MPYGRRYDWPGALHHVMSRGVNGMEILKKQSHKTEFIHLMNRYLPDAGLKVHAWALMNNHFHLLTETGDVPLSAVMHRLLTSWSKRYNFLEERQGRVFQNRFKSILIDKESYYFTVIAYINLNPLRSGYVENENDLGAYPFGGHSYSEGARKRFKWEYDIHSDRDYSKQYRKSVLRQKLKLDETFSANTTSVLSRTGLKKGPAFDDDHVEILGENAYALDVVRSSSDRRLQPLRNRHEQHKMAEAALGKVQKIFDLPLPVIMGRSRCGKAYQARRMLINYLILFCGFSYSDAARYLGRTRQAVAHTFKKGTNGIMLNALQQK